MSYFIFELCLSDKYLLGLPIIATGTQPPFRMALLCSTGGSYFGRENRARAGRPPTDQASDANRVG